MPGFAHSSTPPAPVPGAVLAFLRGCRTAGVSGSRAPSATSLSVCRQVVAALSPACLVVTGCARGIDQAARQLVPAPRLVVYRASAYGRGAWSFAARSVAAVQAVAAAPSPVWLSLPAGPCPAGQVPTRNPRRAYGGRGSGTWAALALAVGLGCPCLVFLPAGVRVPAAWPLTPLSGSPGWFQFAPSSGQGALF